MWNPQSSDLAVIQSDNNSNAAFFLSPYDVLNKRITFGVKVSDPNDNDWIGFVVGYVDASNYHYFTWTRSEPSGGGAPMDGWKFHRVVNGVTTVLAVDETDYTRGWEQDAQYKVTVHYTSGKTVIHLEGGTLAYANGQTLATVSGNFSSGKFAFYCDSQPLVTYENLSFEPLFSPTLSLTGNSSMSVEGATSFSDPGATASDPEDGNLTSVVQVSGSVDLQTVGSYLLTYSVTDSNGIEANATRTVNVGGHHGSDDFAEWFLDRDARGFHSYLDAGAAWTDTVDGLGSLSGAGTVNAGAALGSYQLTFDHTDAAGNAATRLTRSVSYRGRYHGPGVITLTGDQEVRHQVWQAYVDGGATGIDSVEGNLTSSIVLANPVDLNQPGRYVLTYNLTDASGNAAQQISRTVEVYNSAPVDILLSGAIVDENQPAGTWAGELSTNDPDDPMGQRTIFTLWSKEMGRLITRILFWNQRDPAFRNDLRFRE